MINLSYDPDSKRWTNADLILLGLVGTFAPFTPEGYVAKLAREELFRRKPGTTEHDPSRAKPE